MIKLTEIFNAITNEAHTNDFLKQVKALAQDK